MTAKSTERGRFSLRRWSQRKLEAARTEAQSPLETPVIRPDTAAPTQAPAVSPGRALDPPAAELPPIASLTIDSDFAPFFKPQVDESIKRAALKQLFRDPRFNIMDGLDTYIADYTQPDPIPAAMLDDLMQRRVFFPPAVDDPAPRDRAADAGAAERVPTAAASPALPSAGADAQSSAAPDVQPSSPAVATQPVAPATVAEPAAVAPTPAADSGDSLPATAESPRARVDAKATKS
jgi:Protein of unknown function (DUF3306)